MKSALDIMPRCDEARHVWNREIEMNDLPEAKPGQRFAAAHVRDTIFAPQSPGRWHMRRCFDRARLPAGWRSKEMRLNYVMTC